MSFCSSDCDDSSTDILHLDIWWVVVAGIPLIRLSPKIWQMTSFLENMFVFKLVPKRFWKIYFPIWLMAHFTRSLTDAEASEAQFIDMSWSIKVHHLGKPSKIMTLLRGFGYGHLHYTNLRRNSSVLRWIATWQLSKRLMWQKYGWYECRNHKNENEFFLGFQVSFKVGNIIIVLWQEIVLMNSQLMVFFILLLLPFINANKFYPTFWQNCSSQRIGHLPLLFFVRLNSVLFVDSVKKYYV